MGGSRWLLEEATGHGLDAEAMAACFEPLTAWLRERNAGRPATPPERPPSPLDR